ncbi:MAG: GEVED domain-containing protein, partial [Cyanobacteria bacterium J06631_2]
INLGEITGLPATTFFRYIAGDFDQNGRLYVTEDLNGFNVAMDTIYVIDIATLSVERTINLSPAISTNSFINDLTYNHADDFIYAFNQDFKLYKINSTTGAVTTINSDTTNIPGSGNNVSTGIFGAVFTDIFGNLYGIDNGTGDLYQFDTTTGEGIFIGIATTGNFNDGTHCHNAEVLSFDYGDAPDTSIGVGSGNYNTTIFDDGARHFVPPTPTVYLGATAPDFDSSVLQDNTANADNNNATADEDGVLLNGATFQAQRLIAGETVTLDLATSGSGVLNAWIDWNGNGDFTDAGEQIAVNAAAGGVGDSDTSTAGIQLSVAVPSSATVGNTYARFRYSSDPNLQPTGAASDGEVEDYQIAIAPAPLCPAAKADVWFANDESGSISPTEFEDALDFIYQISDGFVYDDVTAMRAGIMGWTEVENERTIIPITESFGDSGDFGLFASSISLNGNNEGVREQYQSRPGTSFGTRLDYATNYLAGLISGSSGDRPNTIQVAVILTDANASEINADGFTGLLRSINAAQNLQNTGAKVLVILIEDAVNAYDNDANSQLIINSIADGGKIIKVPTYAQAANPANDYIQDTVGAVCELSTPVASDPNLLLVKRITAINPGQPGEIKFNDFVDNPDSINDNHPLWPDSDEDPSSTTNLFLRGVLNGGRVKPGDEVEYTIYFLSNGDEDAKDVRICDVVPDHLTYVKDAYGLEIGIALGFNPSVVPTAPNHTLTNLLDDDEGDFYGAGTAPPANLCKKIDQSNSLVTVDGSNNDNGAIIVQPAPLLPPAVSPGQPANSYGFIRFRGKVK